MAQHLFNLQATTCWLCTNINVQAGNTITIQTNPNDRWTANPTSGNYNARGVGFAAKSGYCYAPATEGALVAKIINTTDWTQTQYIEIGLGRTFRATTSGLLYISINDDEAGQWGPGFSDNSGFQNVTIIHP